MRALLLLAFAACAHEAPPTRVEILPLPAIGSLDDASAPSGPLDDLACEPQVFAPVGADSSGTLDVAHLRNALLSAKDFAQRCCSGDEAAEAKVYVTVAPEGYATQVRIEPDALSSTATGGCLYASFHRIATASFHGTAMTVSVPVTLRK